MRQARLIIDGYRLAAPDRIAFVARMIEFAIRSACEEVVVCGIGPTTRVQPRTMSDSVGGHVAGAGAA